MRKNEVTQCIQGLFLESCKGLFQSLDCETHLTSGHHASANLDECPIACIDGGSDDVEFMLALQLPLSVLALTYPVGDDIARVYEDRLEDWISELSNQLIGRLKAKLIEHDCFVSIGLPQSYFGADVHELLAQNSELIDYFFNIDNEVCRCSISIEIFDEAMSFSVEKNQDIDTHDEGELELF